MGVFIAVFIFSFVLGILRDMRDGKEFKKGLYGNVIGALVVALIVSVVSSILYN